MPHGVWKGSSPELHDPSHPSRIEVGPPAPNPKPISHSKSHQLATPLIDISFDRATRLSTKWNHSIAVPLPRDTQPIAPYNVAHSERDKFTYTQTSSVQRLQQCPITKADRIVAIDPVERGGQPTGRDGVGKRPGSLGPSQTVGRIGSDEPTLGRITVEGPDGGGFSGYGSPCVPTCIEESQITPENPAIDLVDSRDAGAVDEIEKLTQVTTICIDRMNRKAPLGFESIQVAADRLDRPFREWRKHSIILPHQARLMGTITSDGDNHVDAVSDQRQDRIIFQRRGRSPSLLGIRPGAASPSPTFLPEAQKLPAILG